MKINLIILIKIFKIIIKIYLENKIYLKMEIQIKCSTKEHSKINAIKYCKKCEIYMCNICLETHSKFLPNHQALNIDKEQNDSISELCRENNHNQILEYFCQTHNSLWCALCITKIKDKGKGQHKDCDICIIENIKDQKYSQLKQNISKLEKISKNLQNIINESTEILKKIDTNKEQLKIKIQKIFTTLRNALNNREEELLSQVDENYKLYYNRDIAKESQKLLAKINGPLEKAKIVDKEWNNKNKLNSLINKCMTKKI